MNDNVTATKSFTFYGTFGSGQPGFPGYLKVTVRADGYSEAFTRAYTRMSDATELRWCALYDSLDKVHPDDRIFRGKV